MSASTSVPAFASLTSLPPMLKAEEVAGVLRTSRKAIYSMIERGQIPYVRIGQRRVLIDRDELLGWIEKRRVPSPGAFPTMTIKIRPYRRGGYEVDIRFTWPDGTRFRERVRSPVTAKSASQRWAEARELALLRAGKPTMIAPTTQKEVPNEDIQALKAALAPPRGRSWPTPWRGDRLEVERSRSEAPPHPRAKLDLVGHEERAPRDRSDGG